MSSLFTGPIRPVFYFLIGLIFLLASPVIYAQKNQQFKKIPLQINQISLYAELAQTDKDRARGLMYRQQLEKDHGMLFVFEQELPVCFWMKNTPLPLSIAFITQQGVISNIEHMQPFSTESHCPVVPIKYALEMEQGWFEQQHIQAGDAVLHLPH